MQVYIFQKRQIIRNRRHVCSNGSVKSVVPIAAHFLFEFFSFWQRAEQQK